MDILFSIILGVGLAASCGFKIFVPFLIMSISSLSGHLELGQGFSWIGTYPALLVFIIATTLEILAYYIPIVDNALDVISGPITVICGVIITASCIQELSPLFTWTLAVILGGTAAASTKALNTSIRATSTTVTAGLGNVIVNTFQTIMSIMMSVASILTPILALLALSIVFYIFVKLIKYVKKVKLKFNNKGVQ